MSDNYLGAFGPSATRRANCPDCRKPTRVSTLFERIDRWQDAQNNIEGLIESYVFQCNGCEVVFFARVTSNSEDYVERTNPYTGENFPYYNNIYVYCPSVPSLPIPSWAGLKLALQDEQLHHLLSSVYQAINSDLPVLAAIGMRTAFDRISEILGVNVDEPFAEKLESLRKDGYISGTQKGILEVLVNAGSAAAHRGWRPNSRQLVTMLEILQALIRDHFILKGDVADLRAVIPTKSEPKKSAD
ncbi:DUF4145 domain-containing protein [Sulfitobacter sp. M368]|uniref:DUF4145 domain-containing protein n=1 Tax=Sulfitobacter sp. M368 TaxID=2867021 RepID=UPI0021A5625F|nr:DUF4145 domain-containing protein [Sulfitobacter sp. M368]UWR16531.1 DUF4145 domain-containing protein [Sulfitobacter sp. M368]